MSSDTCSAVRQQLGAMQQRIKISIIILKVGKTLCVRRQNASDSGHIEIAGDLTLLFLPVLGRCQ